MKGVFTLFTFSFFVFASFSQNIIVSGKVVDAKTTEGIIGASVVPDSGKGTITDVNGAYELNLSGGKHTIKISFIGYKTKTISFIVGEMQNKIPDVRLEEDIAELGTIVVTAGKFEQKIEEVTISMEVIKPKMVENKNTTNIETIIDQVPGVNMMDGQINIRCGSGFSYGAGSRVLLMVDEMPLLS